jgi:gag-polypeptide of LTR copia-type
MEDHESIEEMYNRLLSIQNEFSDLDEPLTNNKVVAKILRVMLRMPRWEELVSVLEAMQGTNDAFTPDELYTHLRCFEKKNEASGRCQMVWMWRPSSSLKTSLIPSPLSFCAR